MFGPAIEQAIFTSVRGRAMDGYQVAATSRGVTSEEAKQLAVWGPAHDALLDRRPGAQSVNFFRLESGKYCVAQTTALDAEYSGRGGCQIYTHCLLAAPETLACFANDPFRLLEAALAAGKLTPHANIPAALEPLTLAGGGSTVNCTLLLRLARKPGAAAAARLVEAALGQRAVAVACSTSLSTLFAGLLNLLPVECRPQFSFTTGLRHAVQRPFRLSPLAQDPEERRRVATRGGAVTLDLNEGPAGSAPASGWAAYIFRVLQENAVSQFAAAMRQPRPELALGDLAALAQALSASTRFPAAAIN